jgi:uncharacterized membrane protein YczE
VSVALTDELDAADLRRSRVRVGTLVDPFVVGRARRPAAIALRIALHAAGSLVIATCVAVMLWNDFGAGPLDVFIGALRDRTGLPLAVSVWITLGALMLVAWALGRRPGMGTVVGPFVVGPAMQFVLTNLERFDPPQWIVARVAIHLAAVGIVGFGAGAVMAARLGWSTGELLAAAASDRSGRPEQRMRLLFEVTYLAVGGLLGGPIGLGTVLVALCIGPSVANGREWVARGVAASRRQLGAAYAALPR